MTTTTNYYHCVRLRLSAWLFMTIISIACIYLFLSFVIYLFPFFPFIDDERQSKTTLE